ncbi:monocarboxylate transporter 9-like [Mya arenaria]|uniref:monocarboxylate transporter 9-like n=1 Tax=Mya arenaria TaxID=6604 RepID=UPI0022E176A4|nr:monocarboxylate transporter 9-like [Mya arenaria]
MDDGNGKRKKEDDNEDVETVAMETSKALDGGWGWCIILGILILRTVIGGFVRSHGLFYLRFKERFGGTATATSLVMSLSSFMQLSTGPIVSILSGRFQCRIITAIGVVVLATGVIMTAFSPNISFLYFSYGIVSGFGRSLVLTPCPILLGYYFDKRRSLAFGIASAGFSIGGFALTPLVELLFQEYGIQGTFLILTAMSMHIFISCTLFRPIESNRRSVTNSKNKNRADTEAEYGKLLGTSTVVCKRPDHAYHETSNNSDVLNSGVLNSDVLNSDVLNSDVLNSDVLNSDVLNSDVLNSDVHNRDVLNSDVLNSDVHNRDVLNSDVLNSDVLNSDVLNNDVLNSDVHNRDVLNSDVLNSDVLNSDVLNSDILNSDVLNSDVLNSDVLNSDVLNSDVLNSDVLNSDVLNSDVLNSDVLNSDVLNSDVLNSDILNSDVLNSDVLNSDVLNSDVLNSDVLNSDVLNSDVLNSDVLNSDVLNGDVLNSDVLNSDVLNSDVLNSNSDVFNNDERRVGVGSEKENPRNGNVIVIEMSGIQVNNVHKETPNKYQDVINYESDNIAACYRDSESICENELTLLHESQTALKSIQNDQIQEKEKPKKRKWISWSILKNPRFVCYVLSMFCFTLPAGGLFLPALAKSKGCTDIQAATLMSINAASDTVFRVISGFVLDLKMFRNNRPIIYNIITFFQAAALLCFPFMQNFSGFTFLCVIDGLFNGAKMAQGSVVMIDILGVDKMASSLAVSMAVQCIAVIIGPTVSGRLVDIYDGYSGTFFFGGGALFVGGLILVVGNVINTLAIKREQRIKKH